MAPLLKRQHCNAATNRKWISDPEGSRVFRREGEWPIRDYWCGHDALAIDMWQSKAMPYLVNDDVELPMFVKRTPVFRPKANETGGIPRGPAVKRPIRSSVEDCCDNRWGNKVPECGPQGEGNGNHCSHTATLAQNGIIVRIELHRKGYSFGVMPPAVHAVRGRIIILPPLSIGLCP